MVNCKFRATTPLWEHPGLDGGYDRDNSVIDYNYYASGSQKVDAGFVYDEDIEYSWEGYNYDYKTDEEYGDGEVTTSWYDTGKVDKNSIIATEQDSKDPQFVNFPINDVSLTEYVLDEAWDFHLKSDSPALSGAYSANDADMQPLFATSGLTVNGKTYTSPVPVARFGAFGEN